MIAGVTCTDWSSRGAKKMTLGKGAIAFASFAYEVWHYAPDIVIVECTRTFNHGDLISLLNEKYAVSPVVFSPTDLGIPSERIRKYTVLLKRDGGYGGKLTWKADAEITGERFLAKFGRKLVANAHIYLSATPADLVDEERDRRAHRRHIPSGRDVDGRRIKFADTLSPAVKHRCEDWVEEATKSGYDEHAEMIIDVSNNVGWAGLTSSMPALTQKNEPWSLSLRRPVLMEEKYEAQGFPMIMSQATLGLDSPIDLRELRLSRSESNSLVGNSMHFAAVSLVVVYTLLGTELVRR